jgi:hypothetical protein
MKKAENEGINTGWYAPTSQEKIPWKSGAENNEEGR